MLLTNGVVDYLNKEEHPSPLSYRHGIHILAPLGTHVSALPIKFLKTSLKTPRELNLILAKQRNYTDADEAGADLSGAAIALKLELQMFGTEGYTYTQTELMA